jgi:hypothetical protein
MTEADSRKHEFEEGLTYRLLLAVAVLGAFGPKPVSRRSERILQKNRSLGRDRRR